jgi:hypothetical protein
LSTRPKNGSLGTAAETFRVKQGSLIVISQHADLELQGEVDAFTRIGAVSDDVAQAVDRIDLLRRDVRQYGSQRFQISVDVANDRTLQGETSCLRERAEL